MTNVRTVQTPLNEDRPEGMAEFGDGRGVAVSEGTGRRQPSIRPLRASLGLLALAVGTCFFWWIGLFNLD